MNAPRLPAMALLLVSGEPATAADGIGPNGTPVLTLEQAIHAGLTDHPMIHQAQLDVDIAEVRTIQARSTRFPQIDAGGIANVGLTGAGNLFGLHGLAASPRPEGRAVSANVYQDLLDFGRTKLETKARQSELEFFAKALLAERANVALTVTQAFYAVLDAEARAEASAAAVEEQTLESRRAEALYREGIVSGVDLESSRSELSNARFARTAAEEAARRALAELNTVMGRDPTQNQALQDPSIPTDAPQPLDALIAMSLNERPELTALDARIRAMEEWVQRAERERYPRVMAMFSGGWVRLAEMTLDNLIFGGFGIRLPLLSGGRLRANIEETRLNAEKTRVSRDDLVRKIKLQVAAAHGKLLTALESIPNAEHAVRKAQEMARLASARNANDLSDVYEVTVAQSAVRVAESQRERALYDYKVAVAELRFAVGMPLY